MRQFKSIALLIAIAACTGCSSQMLDAAERGDVAKIQSLAKSHPSWVNARGDHGYTALHRAVICCQPDAVEALVDLGADTELLDHDKVPFTPLQTAEGMISMCDQAWVQSNVNLVGGDGREAARINRFREIHSPENRAKLVHIKAILEKAQLTVIGPDGKRYPVIARLAPMYTYGAGPSYQFASHKPTPAITIATGPKGPMYTARQGDKVIVRNATIEQLQAGHPDLYNQVKNRFASDREYMAEHSSARDFTLSPRPVPSAADGPAMDRFLDASEGK